jgi:hypothetical protein
VLKALAGHVGVNEGDHEQEGVSGTAEDVGGRHAVGIGRGRAKVALKSAFANPADASALLPPRDHHRLPRGPFISLVAFRRAMISGFSLSTMLAAAAASEPWFWRNLSGRWRWAE